MTQMMQFFRLMPKGGNYLATPGKLYLRNVRQSAELPCRGITANYQQAPGRTRRTAEFSSRQNTHHGIDSVTMQCGGQPHPVTRRDLDLSHSRRVRTRTPVRKAWMANNARFAPAPQMPHPDGGHRNQALKATAIKRPTNTEYSHQTDALPRWFVRNGSYCQIGASPTRDCTSFRSSVSVYLTIAYCSKSSCAQTRSVIWINNSTPHTNMGTGTTVHSCPWTTSPRKMRMTGQTVPIRVMKYVALVVNAWYSARCTWIRREL